MIIHVDMDAFYASVEIRDRPKLRHLPVVVGGLPGGRGVVSAANYEARKYGVHSAMPVAEVQRRCPNAVFIKPRMAYYANVSSQIHSIFDQFTSLVEPLSLDEAFLDVSGSLKLFGEPDVIAANIRKQIKNSLGLTASAGVAPNKYLAKIASDLKKPDGLVVVRESEVLSFLDPLPVSSVWGVGEKCQAKFVGIGIQTIGQLRKIELRTLQTLFGKNAIHFWNMARGIDNRKVIPDRIAKTISNESTFPSDATDRDIIEGKVFELCEQVGRRLRLRDSNAGGLQIKVRYSDFRTVSRMKRFNEPTDITAELFEAAIELIRLELRAPFEPVRLLGVVASKIRHEDKTQKMLFDDNEKENRKKLDQVRDKISLKFGVSAVSNGRIFENKLRTKKPPEK